MLLWPPLTGTHLSPVAPRSWVLPSGYTPGNRPDQWPKPGEGLRCCVYLHTRLRHPHSWHQFHNSHHHRDHLPLLITCYPHHRNHHRLRLHYHHHHQRLGITTTITPRDEDSLLNCPQCDRTFTSRIGLIGHLRILRTETGEPVPGAPTHRRDRRLHCPHCPRAFTHRTGLCGHMCIHDSGKHHNADNTDTPCAPSAPAILSAPDTPTTMNDIALPLPISLAHTAPATSTHASAWSVTCESIARRLVNQCLGLRHTVDAPAFTALTYDSKSVFSVKMFTNLCRNQFEIFQ
ncbi:unnamed protein product [Schistocephalus solidus]|uniref:C2H2-type domain-containing protein n=1 Tax=Schistocephalus solidus TaxID=70667 RepID=A0A183S7B8_SCHSO|nr:unnamed protein product [Schistocephalus solidus]